MRVFLLVLISFACQAQTDIYKEINRYRIRHFRMPIKRDTVLEKQSSEWLQIMQTRYRGKMVHGTIRRKAKFEVLTNSDAPVDAWMNSRPHRKAILSRRVRKIGISERNGVYCARLR